MYYSASKIQADDINAKSSEYISKLDQTNQADCTP